MPSRIEVQSERKGAGHAPKSKFRHRDAYGRNSACSAAGWEGPGGAESTGADAGLDWLGKGNPPATASAAGAGAGADAGAGAGGAPGVCAPPEAGRNPPCGGEEASDDASTSDTSQGSVRTPADAVDRPRTSDGRAGDVGLSGSVQEETLRGGGPDAADKCTRGGSGGGAWAGVGSEEAEGRGGCCGWAGSEEGPGGGGGGAGKEGGRRNEDPRRGPVPGTRPPEGGAGATEGSTGRLGGG